MSEILRFLLLPAAVGLLLAGCDSQEEDIVITETREVTTRDGAPLLDATSDQRFSVTPPTPATGDPQDLPLQPSSVTGDAPDHWLAQPATQFRDLNFRFGESGFGEVYVTLASGGAFDNVNRWLNQFGAPRVDAAGLAAMRRVPIAGSTGVWIEAEGEYASGMGSPPRPGYGLAGVIAETGGRTITLKMIGPAAEVREQHAALEAFASSLRLRE